MLSRRDMLRRCGAGFGTLGLAALLGQRPLLGAEPVTATGPLAPSTARLCRRPRA